MRRTLEKVEGYLKMLQKYEPVGDYPKIWAKNIVYMLCKSPKKWRKK